MNWVESLVNEIGNNLLLKTGGKNIGIIADAFYSTNANIIYHYQGTEIKPLNQSTLLGFHVIDSITSSESRQIVVRGINMDVFLTLIIAGNQKLDRTHILDMYRIIGKSSPNCKGTSNAKVSMISLIENTPQLIDKHFAEYKTQLIQKQTGLRLYEIRYKINLNTQFK